MEIIFKEDKIYNLSFEPNKDGSVKINIFSKNGTGYSCYTISAEDFDNFLDIRYKLTHKE